MVLYYLILKFEVKLKFNKLTILEHQNQINSNLKMIA
jgi:hypothetical protein